MSRHEPLRGPYGDRRHRPGRYEVHQAKMRGRTVVTVVLAGAALAALAAFVAMLARSP